MFQTFHRQSTHLRPKRGEQLSRATAAQPGPSLHPIARVVVVLLLAVPFAIGAPGIGNESVALAADVVLKAPVVAGTVMTVIHGYNDPLPSETCVIGSQSDHCANQKYGLDLSPSNQSDTRVLAPLPGKIAWISGNCLGLQTQDNLNLTVCHFGSYSVSTGTGVVRGQLLGTRDTSWIHLSLDDRYANPSTKPPVPFNGAHTLEGMSFDPKADDQRNQYVNAQLTSTNQLTAVTGTIPGDLNNDGKVDIFDYNILVSNFGADSPPPVGATPELSSLLLFGTGAAGMASYAVVWIRAGRRRANEDVEKPSGGT